MQIIRETLFSFNFLLTSDEIEIASKFGREHFADRKVEQEYECSGSLSPCDVAILLGETHGFIGRISH